MNMRRGAKQMFELRDALIVVKHNRFHSDFYRDIGISKTNVYHIENGKVNFTIEHFCNAIDCYGEILPNIANWDYLLDMKNHKSYANRSQSKVKS